MKPNIQNEPQSLLSAPQIKNSSVIKVYYTNESQVYKVSVNADGQTTNNIIKSAV
jgi:hypothetical protein